MPSVVVMPLVLSPLIYIFGRWKPTLTRGITLAALGVTWVMFIPLARDLSIVNPNALTFARSGWDTCHARCRLCTSISHRA